MASLHRRQFLQLASGLFGTIGLHQWQQQAIQYGQALAQSTPNKLALLVGINQYSTETTINNLRGAVTDVELQYQLLVHRFGFLPENIIRLSDDEDDAHQPIRENILGAFQNHLINQARPGDVVVFHYSGHGRRATNLIRCPITGCITEENNSTIVPSDWGSTLTQNQSVQDISGQTLFLLLSLLRTSNVTFILDCCYAGGIRKYRARSNDDPNNRYSISPQELDYQQQLLARLGWDDPEFSRRLDGDVEQGLLLYAATKDQVAIDFDFNRFSAGAYTYALTQYLWQRTEAPSVQVAMPPLRGSIQRLLRTDDNIPVPEHNPRNLEELTASSIFHTPVQSKPGDAVITQVIGNRQVELWLGGVAAESLSAGFQPGTQFVITGTETIIKLDALDSGNPLTAIGTITSDNVSIETLVGQTVREESRVIQTDIQIGIGLDESFSESERNFTAQRLTEIENFDLRTEDENPQVIIGRVTEADLASFPVSENLSLPPINSTGLFYSLRNPILDSFGLDNESIEDSLHRLKGKFKQILLHELLHSLINQTASQVALDVSLEQFVTESDNWRKLKQISIGHRDGLDDPSLLSNSLLCLPIGSTVKIRITNNESGELYLCALTIDPVGNIDVVFPWSWDAPDAEMLIPPGRRISIPPEEIATTDDLKMLVTSPTGLNEVLLVASNQPLSSALRSFQSIADRRRGTFRLNEPNAILGDLLSDLDTGTLRGRNDSVARRRQRYELSTRTLAVVSILFNAVDEGTCLI